MGFYGSLTSIPPPPPFVAVSPPKPRFGSGFYNPGQTDDGKNSLKNFFSCLFGLFEYDVADAEEILKAVDKLVVSDEQRSWLGISSAGTGNKIRDVAGLLVLLEHDPAGQLGDIFSEIEEMTKQDWKALGFYDSQSILAFLDKKLDPEIFDGAKDALDKYLDALSDGELRKLCAAFGVRTTKALKKLLYGGIDALSSIPSFDSEKEQDLSGELTVGMVTPAIGLCASNVARQAMYQNQEQAWQEAEQEAQQQEADVKETEAKRKAEAKRELKQMEKREKERKDSSVQKG